MTPPERRARPALADPTSEPVDPGGGSRPAGGVREALLEAARTELDDHGSSEISLRAVARRAGVSHAAPKHHFRDRAGLLTTLAADGHRRLEAALRAALDDVAGGADTARSTPEPPPTTADVVAGLGRAYVEFGLAHSALFDLMFRSDQLRPDDADLVAARAGSLGVLTAAIDRAGPDGRDRTDQDGSALALAAWTFVHGLVVLTRHHAFDGIPVPPVADRPDPAPRLADALIDLFARRFLDHPGPAGPAR